MGDVLTITDLRRITGKPRHVICHALDRYGPAPAGRIGITRIWKREALPLIRQSLAKTERRNDRASAPEEPVA